MNWESIKSTLLNLVKDGGITLLKFFGVLILGIIVIKIVLKVLRLLLKKSKMESITQSFLLSIIKFCLNIILILILVQMLGIPITGLIAILSAAGLAVSLALQDSLSNLANGIIIITTKPFKEGDYITVENVEGYVLTIKMLTTKIKTLDNKLVVIPNSKIINNSVTNYNGNKTRRVNFEFDVSYASDIDKVKSIICDVMVSDGRVLLDPPPFVALKTLGESNITIFAYCWCDAEDYWNVFYYVMDNVFNELKKNNISIDYPHMEVKINEKISSLPYRKEKLQKRVEKVRVVEKEEDLIEKIIHKNAKKLKEKSNQKKQAKSESKKPVKTTKKKNEVK